jgi:hypothetical protein
MFLALAKTTTNIHNLSFLLIFVLGGSFQRNERVKDVEINEGGNVFKRSFKRNACNEVTRETRATAVPYRENDDTCYSFSH